MTLVAKLDFPEMAFSLYFVAYADPSEVPEDPKERAKWMLSRPACLELTHNYGTESDPDFKVATLRAAAAPTSGACAEACAGRPMRLRNLSKRTPGPQLGPPSPPPLHGRATATATWTQGAALDTSGAHQSQSPQRAPCMRPACPRCVRLAPSLHRTGCTVLSLANACGRWSSGGAGEDLKRRSPPSCAGWLCRIWRRRARALKSEGPVLPRSGRPRAPLISWRAARPAQT